VKALRAGLFPAPGHRHRIIGEYGLAVVITLFEAHATAAANVDRRNYLHGDYFATITRNQTSVEASLLV